MELNKAKTQDRAVSVDFIPNGPSGLVAATADCGICSLAFEPQYSSPVGVGVASATQQPSRAVGRQKWATARERVRPHEGGFRISCY